MPDLSSSNYIPEIAYIVAIEGSPYWYTNVDSDLTSQFVPFAAQGGEIRGGLQNIPEINQKVNHFGGISEINSVNVDILDDHEDDHLATFFKNSLQSYDSAFCTSSVYRNDSQIDVDDSSSIATSDLLYFSRETMSVSSVISGTSVSVNRAIYSAFDTFQNPQKFRAISEVAQGVSFGINSGGTHMHNGRYVCIFQMYNFAGSWTGKELIYAGLIQSVCHEGGSHSIQLTSIFDLLKKNIGISYWYSKIEQGYHFSGEETDLYHMYYTKKDGGNFKSGSLVLGNTTFDANLESSQNWNDLLHLGSKLWCNDTSSDESEWIIQPTSNFYGLYETYETKPAVHFGSSMTTVEFARDRKNTGIFQNGYFQLKHKVDQPSFTDGNFYFFKVNFYEEDTDSIIVRSEYDSAVKKFRVAGFFDLDMQPTFQKSYFSNQFEVELITVIYGLAFSRMMLEILTSTGEGINGTYDNLESFQGIGIPEELIDIESFQAIFQLGLQGDLKIIEEKTNFEDYFKDELKIISHCMVFYEGKIRLKEISIPKYVDATTSLDSTDIITQIPNVKKAFAPPVETIEIVFNNEKDKYVINMKDPTQEQGTSQTIKFSSSILTEFPEWLVISNYARLLWYSSEPVIVKLEIARNRIDNFDLTDSLLVSHNFLKNMVDDNYNLTDGLAIITGKNKGESSSITVEIGTSRSSVSMPIYAPSIELDTSLYQNGYDTGTSNIYFLESPTWFTDREITSINAIWIASDGSYCGSSILSDLSSGSTTGSFSGNTDFISLDADRVFLTFEDYNEL
jgi:hypothetical protein